MEKEWNEHIYRIEEKQLEEQNVISCDQETETKTALEKGGAKQVELQKEGTQKNTILLNNRCYNSFKKFLTIYEGGQKCFELSI